MNDFRRFLETFVTSKSPAESKEISIALPSQLGTRKAFCNNGRDSQRGKGDFIACRSFAGFYTWARPSTSMCARAREYSRLSTSRKTALKGDRCNKEGIFDSGQRRVKSAWKSSVFCSFIYPSGINSRGIKSTPSFCSIDLRDEFICSGESYVRFVSVWDCENALAKWIIQISNNNSNFLLGII